MTESFLPSACRIADGHRVPASLVGVLTATMLLLDVTAAATFGAGWCATMFDTTVCGHLALECYHRLQVYE